jgi:hypothetical protein
MEEERGDMQFQILKLPEPCWREKIRICTVLLLRLIYRKADISTS